MKLKPIKTKKEYEAFLDWVEELFDKKIKPTSPEGEQLQVALLLIKQYEDEHYPIPTHGSDCCYQIENGRKGIKEQRPRRADWQ